jgi:transglutaminase-like putative cysteine protease
VNTPPLALAAAILLWGWLGGYLLLAALVAMAIESARLVSGRIELDRAQQYRVADLSTLLAIVAGVAFVATTGFPRAVVLFFHWLPVVLLPLALLQAWGTEREIPLQVLFWSMRRVKLRDPAKVNLGYPYLVLWLLAASTAPAGGPVFDAGLALLVAWALWPLRPDSRRLGAWVSMVLFAVALGYGASVALRDLQIWIETYAPEWIAGGGTRVNPYRGTTDIGRLGELKQSDAIVLRVRAEGPLATPLLLHRASYVEYTGRDWIARGGSFESLASDGLARRWKLAEGTVRGTLAVDEYAQHGDPVLSLPATAIEVASAGLASLKANPLGAVQGAAEPGFVRYRIGIDPESANRSAPTAGDRQIPPGEQETIRRVARQWGLEGLDAAAAVAEVRAKFQSQYTYSTFQEAAARGRTPLGDFLERTKAGHCEHFASATTLLLRAAGIPARYATGYSVQEWSDLERAWIARERHSHAWVRAWVGGRWIDVDTTPATWLSLETAERPAWSRLADAWSWARFRVSQWLDGATSTERAVVFGLPLLVLLAVIAWRLSRLWRRPTARAQAVVARDEAGDFEGAAFLPVARRLESLGSPRLPHETTREWIDRLAPRLPGDAQELALLARLHYRWRFDPRGLAEKEREEFAARADRWTRDAENRAQT